MSIRSQESLRYDTFDYSSTKQSINFSYGLPDPKTFGRMSWPQTLSTNTGVSFTDLLQYTDSYGLPELREQLSYRYKTTRDNVIITSGASQALQLIADAFVNPGDIVLTEDPSYLGALRIFSIAGANVIQLGMDQHGVDIGQLELILYATKKRIALFYTAPVFHNPTGRCISRQRMADVAAILAQHGVPLVQDLVYAELAYDDTAPEFVEAGLNVINVHSFSKIAGPGLRVGWVLAETPIVQRLARLKCDGGVSPIASNMALELLRSSELETHIGWLRQHYKRKRDMMHTILQGSTFCESSYALPLGGFSFWVRLASDVDATLLIETVRDIHNIHLVPGERHGPTSGQYARICFSYMPVDKFEEGLQYIEATYKLLTEKSRNGKTHACDVESHQLS